MAKQGAFFLDPDEAKTLGDIEYMRTTNKITHKFPKNGNNGGGFEIVTEVNAMEKRGEDQAQPQAPTSEPSTPVSSTETPRRTNTDSSLDMFRQMAKSIKR